MNRVFEIMLFGKKHKSKHLKSANFAVIPFPFQLVAYALTVMVIAYWIKSGAFTFIYLELLFISFFFISLRKGIKMSNKTVKFYYSFFYLKIVYKSIHLINATMLQLDKIYSYTLARQYSFRGPSYSDIYSYFYVLRAIDDKGEQIIISQSSNYNKIDIVSYYIAKRTELVLEKRYVKITIPPKDPPSENIRKEPKTTIKIVTAFVEDEN